MKKKICLF